MKAVRYVVAQILGGYIACLLIYAQYQQLISLAEATLEAAGELETVNFTPNGPAGIFAFYVLPETNLGQAFLNEFVCDFLLGVTIWACLDPTNFMATPVSAPFIVALTYGLMVWSYSPVGVAANSARDIGGRLAAISLWGLKAGSGRYAALVALTNIPATILGGLFYEFIFTDSSRVITPSHVDYLTALQIHAEQENQDAIPHPRGPQASTTEIGTEGKTHVVTIQQV